VPNKSRRNKKTETEKEGSEVCAKLGKRGLEAGGAVILAANRILLVSGATVILNILKKSMPRIGPATAACKNLAMKSLPWN
jgi:hypothetical protein